MKSKIHLEIGFTNKETWLTFFFLTTTAKLSNCASRFGEPSRWCGIDIKHTCRGTSRTTCKYVRQGVLCSWNMSDPEIREETLTASEFFHVYRESWSVLRCRHHLHQLRTIRRKHYIRELKGLHALHCPYQSFTLSMQRR